MLATAHLNQLKNKHANLDKKIKNELKNPQPDGLLITNLKKQKLFLKDQISSAHAG